MLSERMHRTPVTVGTSRKLELGGEDQLHYLLFVP